MEWKERTIGDDLEVLWFMEEIERVFVEE